MAWFANLKWDEGLLTRTGAVTVITANRPRLSAGAGRRRGENAKQRRAFNSKLKELHLEGTDGECMELGKEEYISKFISLHWESGFNIGNLRAGNKKRWEVKFKEGRKILAGQETLICWSQNRRGGFTTYMASRVGLKHRSDGVQ